MRCARFPQVRSGAAVGLVVVLMGLITPPRAADTVPGMPPVVDPANLCSETKTLSPAVVGTLARVYVPHLKSNDVDVIDPATFKVIGSRCGGEPAARGAIVGPQDALGDQQCGGAHRWEPDPHRSDGG